MNHGGHECTVDLDAISPCNHTSVVSVDLSGRDLCPAGGDEEGVTRELPEVEEH